MSKASGNSVAAPNELPICPRCGATAEAEAFQCAECGEHLRRTTVSRSSVIFVDNRRPRGSFARGISRPEKSPRKSVVDAAVTDVEPQESWPEWDNDEMDLDNLQFKIPWPGDFAIFRSAILFASGALVLAGLSYGMAWLWKSAGVTFLQAAIGLGILAACSVGMAVAAIAGRRGLAAAKVYFEKSEERRLQASVEPQVTDMVSRNEPAYPPEPEYYYQPQFVPRGTPGPATIICGVLAIILSVITLLFSVVPVLGLFAFVPAISTVIFLALSLTLAHYERSERMMQWIATGILVLALLVSIGQHFFFGTAFRFLNDSLKGVDSKVSAPSGGPSGQVGSTNLLGKNARPATEGLFDKTPARPAATKVTPRPAGVRYTPRPTAARSQLY